MKQFWDPEDSRTLRAALDRIVPADDYPSASELGCDAFIQGLIEQDRELGLVYRTGLRLLRDRRFADLTVPERDEILLEMESHPFVQLLIRQTIEGYYSDPGNGGNRDGRSWEMVGFEVRG
ncbi:MAG TPA: gluconate 2-dehydrogenase subunit 3 family protein [Fimbriimonas sp.]|nr:gluconate 2-dehydrogenase subunit 3 family protein [Fimbriimonas sp.]